jgi:hypothetical protein
MSSKKYTLNDFEIEEFDRCLYDFLDYSAYDKIVVLNRYVGNDECVVIPSGIDYINCFAFFGNTSIKSVFIPNTVKDISTYAFGECKNLKRVEIELLTDKDDAIGLHVIGASAFYDCVSLKEINLPNTVTYIDDVAFTGCTSLDKLNLPDSVVRFGEAVFCGCFSFSLESFPKSMTSIPAGFCAQTSSFHKIPDWVTTIERNAFYAIDFDSLFIPASVTKICGSAFSFVEKLYYAGTEEQFSAIEIEEDNNALITAEKHFNATFQQMIDEMP